MWPGTEQVFSNGELLSEGIKIRPQSPLWATCHLGQSPAHSGLLFAWLAFQGWGQPVIPDLEVLGNDPPPPQHFLSPALPEILDLDWGSQGAKFKEVLTVRIVQVRTDAESERVLKILHSLGTSLTSSLPRTYSQNTRYYLFKKYIVLAQGILVKLMGRISLKREHGFSISRWFCGLGVKAQASEGVRTNSSWLSISSAGTLPDPS